MPLASLTLLPLMSPAPGCTFPEARPGGGCRVTCPLIALSRGPFVRDRDTSLLPVFQGRINSCD